MDSLIQPTLLLKPFAQNGDRNDIPLVNNNLSNPQLADLTVGFPEITSVPPAQGGLPPERRDFNALGYLTTAYDYFYQAGGTFTFSQTICTAIGGYPLGARLWYTNSSGVSCILRSTIANNTNNFLNDESVIGESGSGKPWEVENFRGISIKGFSLFEFKWSDHLINDISWLRGDTFSWQSGDVYVSCYNHLVNDIDGKTSTTETINGYTITYYLADDGHKVVLGNQESVVQDIFNATGVSWYYILDTTNKRFKLPRENPAREELIQIIRAKGNGISVGWTNGTDLFGSMAGGNGLDSYTGDYGKDIGTTYSGTRITNGKVCGITFDSTKSGIISDMTESTSVYKGKKYLYFYVGQFAQTAIEQTAGLNSELFNGKADIEALNNKIQQVSTLPASPTAGVLYVIPE